MKNCFSRPAVKSLAGFLAAAALWGAAAPTLSAADATNAEATPAKHGLNFQFKIGPDKSDTTNYYGLPIDAFNRLSPEQMVELAKANQPPAAVILVVPVAMFAMIIGCVWLGVSQRSRRARMLHETLRLMIEKGQPIPPDLLQFSEGSRRPRNDLRNGLILIAVGVGLGILLLAQSDADWPIALIPLLMGVAFLVARKMEANPNGQPQ